MGGGTRSRWRSRSSTPGPWERPRVRSGGVAPPSPSTVPGSGIPDVPDAASPAGPVRPVAPGPASCVPPAQARGRPPASDPAGGPMPIRVLRRRRTRRVACRRHESLFAAIARRFRVRSVGRVPIDPARDLAAPSFRGRDRHRTGRPCPHAADSGPEAPRDRAGGTRGGWHRTFHSRTRSRGGRDLPPPRPRSRWDRQGRGVDAPRPGARWRRGRDGPGSSRGGAPLPRRAGSRAARSPAVAKPRTRGSPAGSPRAGIGAVGPTVDRGGPRAAPPCVEREDPTGGPLGDPVRPTVRVARRSPRRAARGGAAERDRLRGGWPVHAAGKGHGAGAVVPRHGPRALRSPRRPTRRAGFPVSHVPRVPPARGDGTGGTIPALGRRLLRSLPEVAVPTVRRCGRRQSPWRHRHRRGRGKPAGTTGRNPSRRAGPDRSTPPWPDPPQRIRRPVHTGGAGEP